MKSLLIFFVAGLSIAQTSTGGGTLGGIITGIPMGGIMAAPMISSGRAVTGMPYSAEQVTEHVQTLADGTRITLPTQKMLLYRDSQGRTRTERTVAMAPLPGNAGIVPPGFIDIADPVSGVRYNLDVRAHVAHKYSAPKLPPPPPGGTPLAPGNRVSSVGLHSAPMIAPAIAPANTDINRPQVSHESLGQQTIEGVTAQGTRTSIVYPIGAIGNDRPITTVSENWISPELGQVVLSKLSDPRNGESTTRLINISRAEPAAYLFEVPADYQIVEPISEQQAAAPGH